MWNARGLEDMTEEEIAVFKRGRNSHSIAIPKSARAGEYRRATGMEALFAWLCIHEKQERMKELFAAAFQKEENSSL